MADISNYISHDTREERPQQQTYKEPTEIELYTITTTFNFGTKFDLDTLSRGVELHENGILSVCYKSVKRAVSSYVKKKKNNKKKEEFYNQCTLIVRPRPDKKINAKIFKNGKVQMTGAKSDADNKCSILILMKFLNNPTFHEMETLYVNNIQTRMINSGFDAKCGIDRKKINILLKTAYGIKSKLDTMEHVGVRAVYHPIEKVTILIFRTGKILIISKCLDSIYEAYTFINRVIKENFNVVTLPLEILKKKSKEKFKKIVYKNNTLFLVKKGSNRVLLGSNKVLLGS
jgi:TATA-box binding protein (TBP) (component of TFIID and TFIIIB)